MLASMRSSPARLLACLVALAGGVLTVAALWLIAVADRRGRAVDDALMERVADLGSAVRGEALALLGLVSVATVGLAVVALVAVAVLRGRPARAGVVVAVVLGAQLATQVLKTVLPRGGTDDNSLPSGHVTVVASLAVGLVLVLPGLLRPLAGLLGIGAVAMVGTATLVAQWHRPADVVAALGVVAAAAGAALAAEALLTRRPSDDAPRTRPLPPTVGHDRTTVRLPVGAR